MITRQENLRRVLAGQKPAWVPFAPNFGQWFGHHQNRGTLPEEIRDCASHIEALRRSGCDIFTRYFDGGYRERNTKIIPTIVHEPTSLGGREIITTATPRGALRKVVHHQTALSTSHVDEYPVKDWTVDGAAFRSWLEQWELDWDEAPFLAVADQIGDDGLANLPLGYTPLKFLHHQFGLDGTCLFIADDPGDARAVCDAYWARLRPLLARAAAHPRVESVILMDNVDTPFYPPALAREYWAPYVADAAALLREGGKYLFVHACGKLAGLAPVFAECRVSGLEGIAHPPLGDWEPAAAVACHDRFVFIGGITPLEQSLPAAQLRRFFERYLAGCPRERVIFSTACNTEINTPWETIVVARDLVRAWGGQPDAATPA